MRRREIITLGAAASLAWPPSVRSQSAAIPVIGYLGMTSAGQSEGYLSGFRDGLAQYGYVEGRNVAIVFRWPEGHYVTGIFTNRAELTPKRLQLLHELVADARSVAFLSNPANPTAGFQLAETRAVARSRKLELALFEAGSPDEIDQAFARMAGQRADALVVLDDPLYTAQRGRIVALAARHAIPAIYSNRESAALGGLMAYGPSIQDIARMLGVYAAKILGGARPADLPVERPTRFELVINLKAASALGLTVPPSLLASVDEVIE
jgi:putative ABC transport system substrate-binding protein